MITQKLMPKTLEITKSIHQIVFASEFISGMGLYNALHDGQPTHMLVLHPFDGTLLRDGLDHISKPRTLTHLPTPRQFHGLSPDDTTYWHSKINAFDAKARLFMERLTIDLGKEGFDISRGDKGQLIIVGDIPRALERIETNFSDAETFARREGIRVITSKDFSKAAATATHKLDEIQSRLFRLSKAMGEDSPMLASVKRVILEGQMSERLTESLHGFKNLATRPDMFIGPSKPTAIHVFPIARGKRITATIG
jgi:hypothetical protein